MRRFCAEVRCGGRTGRENAAAASSAPSLDSPDRLLKQLPAHSSIFPAHCASLLREAAGLLAVGLHHIVCTPPFFSSST